MSLITASSRLTSSRCIIVSTSTPLWTPWTNSENRIRQTDGYEISWFQPLFSSSYTPQAQSDLILPTPMPLNALTSLIQEIAGFFIVETHVLKTTGNFRSEQELEELWDSLLGRLCLALDDALNTETDPEGYLRVKEALIGFIMTMEVRSLRPFVPITD